DYHGLPTAPVVYGKKPSRTGIDWDQINADYIANGGHIDDTVWPKAGKVVVITGNARSSRANLHTFTEAQDDEYDEPTPAVPKRAPRPKLAHSKIDSEQRIVVGRRYQNGESAADIARDYNVSPKTVYSALRMAGVEVRDRNESVASRGKLAGKREEIGRRYVAGESMQSLADAYGVTLGSIYKTIKNLGIQARPQGRPS
ncbi:MAG TPA: helix-turn-helix domain-containing protein, partial [Kribbella sp.]